MQNHVISLASAAERRAHIADTLLARTASRFSFSTH